MSAKLLPILLPATYGLEIDLKENGVDGRVIEQRRHRRRPPCPDVRPRVTLVGDAPRALSPKTR